MNFLEPPISPAQPSDQNERLDPSRSWSKLSSGIVSGRVAGITFQSPEAAVSIFVHVTKRLSPVLAGALPALLAESPDPDSALILFDRLVSESPAEVTRLLDQHNFLAHYAIVIFGHSRYLGETLIKNPDILQSFLRERNLDLSFSHDHFQENLSRFRARSLETDVSLLLARFKRREYLRIMLRDVLKIAPLAETTAEISALADVLIAEALRDAQSALQRQYGTARHLDAEDRLVDTPFSVLALGKLGGSELNYSSDVDLTHIFGDGRESPEASVSNREYFIRLSQHVTETLSRVTSEGPVFRIDLRLRPQGNEGELAISMETALRYYASTAQDWERQALIKLRHCAGNILLAREFIRRVQPLVYRVNPASGNTPQSDSAKQSNGPAERLNFAAIKTALVARERLDKRRHKSRAQRISGATIDIKLDHGGIRDIEFLVQCLQRVYGGTEPWLRSGGTLFSLHKLHDKGHISGKEFHDLTNAYEFLRHLEHRLQLRQGQQTHRLPFAQPELTALQKSMEGYAPQEYQIKDLVDTVRRRMATVSEIYQHVIYQQQSRIQIHSADAGFSLNGAPDLSGDQSNQQILDRLAQDAPELHRIITRGFLNPHASRNLFRFLSSAFTTSQRYAVLVQNPQAMTRALGIFVASDYLTDVLVRHPEEIATLAEIGGAMPRGTSGYLFASPLGHGRAAADPVFEYVATSTNSHGEKLALLRKHFRHCVFAMGARDVAGLCGVYESLDSITAVAEDAVAAALAIAGNPDGLAIMAVGRLGSRELDVLSDADLLFVAERDRDRERLTKAAHRVMDTLSAYTQDGMVFPVDARLRPRGGAGELIITPAQLAVYFEQEAQPWEALMYTKLRFVAGSSALSNQVVQATERLYDRYSGNPGFLDAVRAMREKLATADSSERSFKTSPGGTYDIDFLTGYLLIKHGIRNKQGSLRDRLWRCAAAGLLQNSHAARMDHAAELFRTVEHVARLCLGRVQKWLPRMEHAQEYVERLTSQIMNTQFGEGLETELLRTSAEVRDIYNRVLA
ncbi:MAG: putative nucleotidyltransferase substrate binding domain-containing protein [Terriglobales bacterium]